MVILEYMLAILLCCCYSISGVFIYDWVFNEHKLPVDGRLARLACVLFMPILLAAATVYMAKSHIEGKDISMEGYRGGKDV